MNNLPVRKTNRLKNYDYTKNGVYFVTVCVHKHQNFLGQFINNNGDIAVGATALGRPHKQNTINSQIKLTPLGKCVDETIKNANNTNVIIDKYVIMPNHIHLIIVMCNKTGDRGRSPLQYIVRNIKSYVTKFAGFSVWQKSFHDHIIRNEKDYRRITEYIENNPQNWINDCFYNTSSVHMSYI